MKIFTILLMVLVIGACASTPEQVAARTEKVQIAHEQYALVVAACDFDRGGRMVYESGSSTVSPHTRLTLAQMKSASCVYPWSARTGPGR